MVNTETFIENAVERIKREASGKTLIALSGGVDSSICTVLAHKAIGKLLVPVYIDTGLMREGETERIKETFKHVNLQVINGKDRFLQALKGNHRPGREKKNHWRNIHTNF
ncbi:MAG: GMP synthase (glutamine-hydrolysing) [Candidatus Argoarchaeum ethanivorans]|uniref:GMP synthetase n=1 Tax=Candidatus Argoarchaeum ethanivorans TaxID=2608793 RepID=A0A8B3S3N3_9EURY|nr:MAG: GMP synthase (glutamine-hydrolysing) [Candidatus Argoarchaeum ethanivorans]